MPRLLQWFAQWFALTAISLSVLGGAPGTALARTKVEWSRVEVPAGEDAARISKVLRTALTQAAQKTNFGKAKSITLSAKLLSFSAEQRGDVLRVNCTMMGQVQGGKSARSKISFGGSPAQRTELEKQVLTMVANGLVARLAQIVRAHTSEGGPGTRSPAGLDGPRRLL
jgi:hypothetical protein